MAICLTAGTGRQNYVLFQQGRSLWGIGATIPSDGASSDCILRSDQVSKSQAANGAPATTIWNISAAFAGYDKVVYWWHIVLQISDAKVISCEVPTKRVYRGHSGPVRALAFHSAPRNTALFDTLASVSDDGAIRLWPAQAISDSNTAIAEFPIHRHDILAVNFKSQTIASGGKDCIVRIFDAPHLSKIHGHIISANTKRRDEALSQIATLPSSSVIHSLYLSEDASICLIGGGDGWLRVWRRGAAAQQGSTPVAPAYSLVHSQLLHSKALKSLAMPTDDCMVSLGADNVLRVWRVSNNNHSRQ
jgi:WD40 repeat protein